MKNFTSFQLRWIADGIAVPLLLLLSPLGASGTLYDFNNGNDSGWTHFDLSAAGQPGSTYSFPPDGSGGKAYRIFSPAPTVTTVGQARTLSYLASATYTNFTVTVDLLGWDTNLNQAFGVAVRLANVGLGQSTGYVLNYNPIQTPGTPGGEFQLNRLDGEQGRTSALAALTLSPSRTYRMVLTGFGSYLAGRVYDLADLSTPLASLDVVDSTYASGFVGVFNFSRATGSDQTNATGNADSTFDNFSVIASAPTNPPPTNRVYAGAPQVIDSTSMVTNLVDDFTDHTYSTNAGPIGTFADCGITRLFADPIQSLKLTTAGGMADDLGYVGNLLVASNFDQTMPCTGVGNATNAVDVTSQVQTNGNSATFVLRAKENCCCLTGWGTETLGSRSNARFHWQVQLALPKLEAAETGGQITLGWPTNTTGFHLETTTNLAVINSWTRVLNPVGVVGDRNIVVDLITNKSRMYRLKGP